MIIRSKLLALLLSNHGRGGDAREHLVQVTISRARGHLPLELHCNCFLSSLLMSCQSENGNEYAAKLLQSCPTLCDPIVGSPPGSAVPGILQARTLEWVAISFPNSRP